MEKVSLSSLEKRLSDYPHLGQIKHFLTGLLSERPSAVLLYGSLTKGTYRNDSDIDILAIFDTPLGWEERFHKVYAHSRGYVQPRTYTVEELLKMIGDGNTFIIECLEDSWVLHNTNPPLLRKLIKECEKTKKRLKLRRIKDGWAGMPISGAGG